MIMLEKDHFKEYSEDTLTSGGSARPTVLYLVSLEISDCAFGQTMHCNGVPCLQGPTKNHTPKRFRLKLLMGSKEVKQLWFYPSRESTCTVALYGKGSWEYPKSVICFKKIQRSKITSLNIYYQRWCCACSCHALWVSSGYSGFLPRSEDMLVKSIGVPKLPPVMNWHPCTLVTWASWN